MAGFFVIQVFMNCDRTDWLHAAYLYNVILLQSTESLTKQFVQNIMHAVNAAFRTMQDLMGKQLCARCLLQPGFLGCTKLKQAEMITCASGRGLEPQRPLLHMHAAAYCKILLQVVLA